MTECSAGGVITKKENNIIYVLLVEHKDKTFVFPKGHIKKNETPEEAAKREITEEVGLIDIVVGEKLGTIKRTSEKPDGRIVKKNIEMFRILVNNYTHSKNTDEAFAWFKMDEVISKLRYKEDSSFFLNIISSLA